MAQVDPLPIGVVARAHGLRGELRVSLFSRGSNAFDGLARIVLRRPGQADREVAIQAVRPTNEALLVTLEGVADRDAAAALAGCELCVWRKDLAAPTEAEVFVVDLVGCQTFDKAGRFLGRVASIFRTAAHEVLVLHDEEARVERLMPLVPELVIEADPARGRLIVDAPEGLPESPLGR